MINPVRHTKLLFLFYLIFSCSLLLGQPQNAIKFTKIDNTNGIMESALKNNIKKKSLKFSVDYIIKKNMQEQELVSLFA